MRDRDGRGWNLVVFKPGTDQLECVRMRSDKLCDLLLGQVHTVSVTHNMCIRV
jgi:hypothetical protein